MKKLITIILPLMILVIWTIISHFEWVNSYLLPSPYKTLESFYTLIIDGILIKHILISLFRVLIGFCIAFILAMICAILFYFYPYLYNFFHLIFHFIQHIPPLAFLTLLILWLGIGEESKITMIILASFFPIFMNTYNAMKNTDSKWLDLGKVAKFSDKKIFFKIIIPSIRFNIITGMKLGLTYAWRSLIGAEFIATSFGLGYMILDARELSRSDVVIVGIIMFGFIGLILDKAFSYFLSKYSYGMDNIHELY